MLTQEQVRRLLSYNPKTGILTRRSYGGGRKAGDVCGYLKKSGYIHLSVKNKNYLAHRVIFLHVYGYLPDAIDHIDGNRSNNALSNLRACSVAQNNWNIKVRPNSKTGIKGVTWCSSSKKWRAQVSCKGMCNLEHFDSIKEAEKAVREKRSELHGEFANHG